jgi:putative inorganic carbon (hco3(-)) transporter
LMLGILAALVSISVSGLTDHVLFNIQLSMLYWMLNAVVAVVWINYGKYR